tara:strand:- start:414 stop:641 length:228 start_codon:yes stop_codon:yes gene_type:complete
VEVFLSGLLLTVIGGWIGSIEFRMRQINDKLRDVPTREEVGNTIDIKQESIKVLQLEIKEDIKELTKKVDKLISS